MQYCCPIQIQACPVLVVEYCRTTTKAGAIDIAPEIWGENSTRQPVPEFSQFWRHYHKYIRIVSTNPLPRGVVGREVKTDLTSHGHSVLDFPFLGNPLSNPIPPPPPTSLMTLSYSFVIIWHDTDKVVWYRLCTYIGEHVPCRNV
jgi:hypothetical protein